MGADPNQSTHKKKRLPILATWEPKIGYQTKFVSVHTESFAGPSGQSSVQVDEQVILQRNALEKFSRFACNNFGSALRMFESFDKTPGDLLTESELYHQLRQRRLNDRFTLEDQQKVFEMFDSDKKGSIPVRDLWKVLDECHAMDVKQLNDKKRAAARKFIASKAGETSALIRELDSLESDVKPGDDTSMSSLLHEVETSSNYCNSPASDHHHHFSKLAKVQMLSVPFYQLRSDLMCKLEARAESLDESKIEGISTRLAEVNRARSMEWAKLNEQTVQLSPLKQSFVSKSPTRSGGLTVLTQSNSSSELNLNSAKVGNLSPSSSMKPRDLSGTAAWLSPIVGKGSHTPVNTSHHTQITECMDSSNFENSASHSIPKSHSVPSMYPSNSRLSFGGKKLFNLEQTDMSVNGIGGSYAGNDSLKFETTSNCYFSEYTNKPSQPVSRAVLGDADRDHLAREERRMRRQVRTHANLERTRQRIESETLQKEVDEHKRLRKKNDDLIRYNTAVFLHDLKCFDAMPLATKMSKKPDYVLSEKNFGGQLRGLMGSDRQPVLSTYQTSFDSSILLQDS